ncbi:MAG TPA: hypothetical protein VLF93_01535 [Candidatus Saccharimonadales bacterium]|nr:hypothetical protein [Candidatus Saccharimonadales bacterium]
MKQSDFVAILQERARAQKKAMDAVPFPRIFAFVIEWLSDHPWRFLIPLAFLISLVLRGIIGPNYTNIVLQIFRSI